MKRVATLLLGLVLVSAAAAPTTGATASPPKLYAWAMTARTQVAGVSRLHWRGPLVRRLAPGRYRISISVDQDLSFHLYGPGIDRRTAYSTTATTYIFANWSVRLRKGVYRYAAEGVMAKRAATEGLRTRGSFVVR